MLYAIYDRIPVIEPFGKHSNITISGGSPILLPRELPKMCLCHLSHPLSPSQKVSVPAHAQQGRQYTDLGYVETCSLHTLQNVRYAELRGLFGSLFGGCGHCASTSVKTYSKASFSSSEGVFPCASIVA